MSKFLNAILIFLVATVIHWIFMLAFSPFDINIGIMLAFCLIMGSLISESGGYVFAFISGLFLDFFRSTLFGGYALVFTLIMFIFNIIHDKIDFKDIGPQLFVTSALNIVCIILYGILGSIFTGHFIWQGFKSLIFGSAFTGLLMPVLYSLTVRYLTFKSLRGGERGDNENKAIF